MQIAVAASAGRKAVTVRPRPRVVVLSTGDELTEPGTPLVPGRIWDSNSYMIAAAAREAGAVAYRRSVVPDDPSGVLPALEEQLIRADLLITTGGVSMGGEHDVVKAALRELGTVTFRKVAMQPGMPQGFGVIGEDQGADLHPARQPGQRLRVVPALRQARDRGPAGRGRPVAARGAGHAHRPGALAVRAAVLPARRARRQQGHAAVRAGLAPDRLTSAGPTRSIIVPEWETQLPAGDTVDVLVLP